MNFNLTRETLAIKSRANEGLGHFDGPSAFDFDKIALLYHIGHLLLLLLTLVCLLFQIVDLFDDVI